ncbi:MAG: transcriptional regulator [Bacteroidetes bacterium]|nr:transcriptional regulator [Bacteroidota bacterium]
MQNAVFLVKLGAKIRKVRKEKNLSLDKLAALCDYEKANLSRIESGKTNTTILTLYTISKAMEVDMCEFFED